jgi:hypothetical protein
MNWRKILITIAFIVFAFIGINGECPGTGYYRGPEILRIIAQPDTVSTNSNVSLSVELDNYNGYGGPVSYYWRCDQGYFSDTFGQSVTWTSPNTAGFDTIEVQTIDTLELSDEALKVIIVK